MASFAFLVLLLASGEAVGSPLLATFNGGVVTLADLEREESFLSKDERTFREVKKFSAEASRRDWVERIALRRITRRLAESEGLTADPARVELARGVARDFFLGRWRQSCYGFGLELPSDEALAAELSPTLVPLPPRLKLSHLFLRAATPAEVAAATAELESLRAEIRSLEDFQRLARERSQSGSAAKGGELGWVRQGWLRKEAEEVLYGLAQGTLSRPLALEGGVHLFWVEDTKPREPPPLALAVRKRRRELTASAQDECRTRRLGEAAGRSDLGPGEVVSEDERLYRLGLALGAPTAEERARLGDLEDNVWLDQVVARRVDARQGEPGPGELERRFEAAPQSLRRPRQLAVRRLVAPLPAGREPLAFFDALRQQVEAVATGTSGWEELVRVAGTAAKVEAVPLNPVIDVAAFLGPAIFDRIQRLPKGSVAGPFQDESGLVVVKIEDERPEAALSFTEAREQLLADWKRARRRALRGVVAAELLAEAHFELSSPLPKPSPEP